MVSLKTHSFVVIDDQNGEIKGLTYDWVCNVLSSIKNDVQRTKKLSYPGNYEIKSKDMLTSPNNGKDAYIKTDQLYFFSKNNLKYRVIGQVADSVIGRFISIH